MRGAVAVVRNVIVATGFNRRAKRASRRLVLFSEMGQPRLTASFAVAFFTSIPR